jgi:hypothetical protein
MRVDKSWILVSLIIIITVAGCSKPKSQATDYVFENLTDKNMNVDIYYSQHDYFIDSALLIHGNAKVRGSCVFPLSKFETGHIYYVDIYSDDYLYNNWFWTNATLRDTFMPSQSDFDYIIPHTQYADPSRIVWLNGSGTSTAWKAFNSYNYTSGHYVSIWSSLTAAQQNLQIILNKSSFGTIINGLGLDTTMKFQAFYDQTANISTATFLNPDKTTYATLKSYFNATTYNFNGGKDTMLAYINGLGYFAMARQ